MSIPNFKFIRNDRIGKRGVYFRDGLDYQVISKSLQNNCSSLEHIMPPKVSYLSDIKDAISEILHLYEDVIIMGDFHTNLLKDSIESNNLVQLFNSLNLNILPAEPTFITKHSAMLLDLTIVSNQTIVLNHGQLSAPEISAHDLIY
ncbi:hypothetical protein J437_LFUL016126, partial [Ladona fulva]